LPPSFFTNTSDKRCEPDSLSQAEPKSIESEWLRLQVFQTNIYDGRLPQTRLQVSQQLVADFSKHVCRAPTFFCMASNEWLQMFQNMVAGPATEWLQVIQQIVVRPPKNDSGLPNNGCGSGKTILRALHKILGAT